MRIAQYVQLKRIAWEIRLGIGLLALAAVFFAIKLMVFGKPAETYDYRLKKLNSDSWHLSADLNRAYHLLVMQWLAYMKYLKNNYPYLFAFAMRTNPFDPKASAIVRE